LGDKEKGIMSFLSPNGDGKNDVWTIDYLSNLTNYELSIIDQKGMEILNTKNYQNDWAGMYKNENLPDGTYYYIIKTDSKEYKGAIWLQRGN
jgi:gliding motility-associated-like protein